METVEVALPNGDAVQAPVADDVRLLIPFHWKEGVLEAMGVRFTPGMRVVEAGTHVGLFPRWLNERLQGDVHYLGLEPWDALADVARRNLAGFPHTAVRSQGLGHPGAQPLGVHAAFPLWSGVDDVHAATRIAALKEALPALREHGLEVLRESGMRGKMAWHALRLAPERVWRPPLMEALDRWAMRTPVDAHFSPLASILSSEGLDRVDLLRLDTAGGTLQALAASRDALDRVGAVLVSVEEGEAQADEVGRQLEQSGFRVRRWPEQIAGRTFRDVGVVGFAPWTVYGESVA